MYNTGSSAVNTGALLQILNGCFVNKPAHDKTYSTFCAISEDSDQPVA